MARQVWADYSTAIGEIRAVSLDDGSRLWLNTATAVNAVLLYGPTVEGVKQLPTLAPGVQRLIIGWTAVAVAIIGGWVFLLWRPQTFLRQAAMPAAKRCGSPARLGRRP